MSHDLKTPDDMASTRWFALVEDIAAYIQLATLQGSAGITPVRQALDTIGI